MFNNFPHIAHFSLLLQTCSNPRMNPYFHIKVQIFCFLFIYIFSNAALGQFALKREVRGVWIATVKNIDWPSKPGLPVQVQKEEAINLLERLKNAGINTVYLQVRSASDALYGKSREPWAEWLEGKQGLAPNPYYDPLDFFIEQCHERGMELQAWLNPYRAVFNNKNSSITAEHISKKHPEWTFRYGGRTLLNPGIPEVRTYIDSMVSDLVRNYDLDGIHLDDYFYPYPVAGIPVPDWASFKKYGSDFSKIEDWRRNNINILVHELGVLIKKNKPWVKFGISPFGIWKNKSQDSLGSPTLGGSTFMNQYADSRLWLQNLWVDYLIPQIYFSRENKQVPFDSLANWWNLQAGYRPILIGLGTYRVGEKKEGWDHLDMVQQEILISRKSKKYCGNAFYSAKSFTINKLGWVDSLKNGLYQYRAFPPSMPWVDSLIPPAPLEFKVDSGKSGLVFHWKEPVQKIDSTHYFILYKFPKGSKHDSENPASISALIYKKTEFMDPHLEDLAHFDFGLSLMSRTWNESKIVLLEDPTVKSKP